MVNVLIAALGFLSLVDAAPRPALIVARQDSGDLTVTACPKQETITSYLATSTTTSYVPILTTIPECQGNACGTNTIISQGQPYTISTLSSATTSGSSGQIVNGITATNTQPTAINVVYPTFTVCSGACTIDGSIYTTDTVYYSTSEVVGPSSTAIIGGQTLSGTFATVTEAATVLSTYYSTVLDGTTITNGAQAVYTTTVGVDGVRSTVIQPASQVIATPTDVPSTQTVTIIVAGTPFPTTAVVTQIITPGADGSPVTSTAAVSVNTALIGSDGRPEDSLPTGNASAGTSPITIENPPAPENSNLATSTQSAGETDGGNDPTNATPSTADITSSLAGVSSATMTGSISAATSLSLQQPSAVYLAASSLLQEAQTDAPAVSSTLINIINAAGSTASVTATSPVVTEVSCVSGEQCSSLGLGNCSPVAAPAQASLSACVLPSAGSTPIILAGPSTIASATSLPASTKAATPATSLTNSLVSASKADIPISRSTLSEVLSTSLVSLSPSISAKTSVTITPASQSQATTESHADGNISLTSGTTPSFPPAVQSTLAAGTSATLSSGSTPASISSIEDLTSKLSASAVSTIVSAISDSAISVTISPVPRSTNSVTVPITASGNGVNLPGGQPTTDVIPGSVTSEALTSLQTISVSSPIDVLASDVETITSSFLSTSLLPNEPTSLASPRATSLTLDPTVIASNPPDQSSASTAPIATLSSTASSFKSSGASVDSGDFTRTSGSPQSSLGTTDIGGISSTINKDATVVPTITSSLSGQLSSLSPSSAILSSIVSIPSSSTVSITNVDVSSLSASATISQLESMQTSTSELEVAIRTGSSTLSGLDISTSIPSVASSLTSIQDGTTLLTLPFTSQTATSSTIPISVETVSATLSTTSITLTSSLASASASSISGDATLSAVISVSAGVSASEQVMITTSPSVSGFERSETTISASVSTIEVILPTFSATTSAPAVTVTTITASLPSISSASTLTMDSIDPIDVTLPVISVSASDTLLPTTLLAGVTTTSGIALTATIGLPSASATSGPPSCYNDQECAAFGLNVCIKAINALETDIGICAALGQTSVSASLQATAGVSVSESLPSTTLSLINTPSGAARSCTSDDECSALGLGLCVNALDLLGLNVRVCLGSATQGTSAVASTATAGVSLSESLAATAGASLSGSLPATTLSMINTPSGAARSCTSDDECSALGLGLCVNALNLLGLNVRVCLGQSAQGRSVTATSAIAGVSVTGSLPSSTLSLVSTPSGAARSCTTDDECSILGLGLCVNALDLLGVSVRVCAGDLTTSTSLIAITAPTASLSVASTSFPGVSFSDIVPSNTVPSVSVPTTTARSCTSDLDCSGLGLDICAEVVDVAGVTASICAPFTASAAVSVPVPTAITLAAQTTASLTESVSLDVGAGASAGTPSRSLSLTSGPAATGRPCSTNLDCSGLGLAICQEVVDLAGVTASVCVSPSTSTNAISVPTTVTLAESITTAVSVPESVAVSLSEGAPGPSISSPIVTARPSSTSAGSQCEYDTDCSAVGLSICVKVLNLAGVSIGVCSPATAAGIVSSSTIAVPTNSVIVTADVSASVAASLSDSISASLGLPSGTITAGIPTTLAGQTSVSSLATISAGLSISEAISVTESLSATIGLPATSVLNAPGTTSTASSCSDAQCLAAGLGLCVAVNLDGTGGFVCAGVTPSATGVGIGGDAAVSLGSSTIALVTATVAIGFDSSARPATLTASTPGSPLLTTVSLSTEALPASTSVSIPSQVGASLTSLSAIPTSLNIPTTSLAVNGITTIPVSNTLAATVPTGVTTSLAVGNPGNLAATTSVAIPTPSASAQISASVTVQASASVVVQASVSADAQVSVPVPTTAIRPTTLSTVMLPAASSTALPARGPACSSILQCTNAGYLYCTGFVPAVTNAIGVTTTPAVMGYCTL